MMLPLHIAHGARDFEIQMLTRDDVVIDTDQIAALKEHPPETWDITKVRSAIGLFKYLRRYIVK